LQKKNPETAERIKDPQPSSWDAIRKLSMSSIRVSLFIFACTLGSALLGMILHGRMPKEHLSSESKDTIKMGLGLVGTMVALVLGLLVASAKAQFDSQNSELTQISVDAIILDRALAQYGEQSAQARATLLEGAVNILDQLSSQSEPKPRRLDPRLGGG